MTKEGHEEWQQQNLESIAELRAEKPFQSPDIEKFYMRHHGDGPNDFISTKPAFRDYHDAIYALLSLIDKYGDRLLYIDHKNGYTFDAEANPHSINLKTHILRFTECVVKSLQEEYVTKADGYNFLMIQGGISALSCNIGLVLGSEYHKHYNNDLCQSSLAILENLPEIRSRAFNTIKELVSHYHRYMHAYMDYARGRIGEHKSILIANTVKILIDSEMQVRRKEIFSFAAKGLLGDHKTQQRAEAEVTRITQQAEYVRQQSNVNLEEEFAKKKEAYVGELQGLRSSRDQFKAICMIQEEIINGLEKGNQATVKQAKKKLVDLKRT